MTRKKLLVLLGSVCLVLVMVVMACAAPAPAPTPGKFSWRLHSDFAAGAGEYVPLLDFADAVFERSGGRLKIDVLPGDSVIPVGEILVPLGAGTVEMMHTAGGYYEGILPVLVMEGGLPCQLMGDIDAFNGLLDAGLFDLFSEAYATQNVHYLGLYSGSAYPCVMSTVPIRSLEDWEGVKVRGFGGWLKLYNKMGASGVWIPSGEMYMSMKLGTIDACTWSVDGIRDLKLYEVMGYLILPPLSDHITDVIAVNMDAWEALPDDLKKVVKEASDDVYGRITYSKMSSEWEMVLGLADALGYEIFTLPDADVEKIREMAFELWDEYAAEVPDVAKGIQITKDFYGIQ